MSTIDPNSIPSFTLSTGAKIPAIGLGTFGSDKYSPVEVATAVEHAIDAGYRHIDCASIYRNEAEIGQSLAKKIGSTVTREDLWITSKVWNDRHSDVVASCEDSLRDLGLDYLDLYLVHWPFPNHHGPGVGVDSRDPHAVPYRHEAYMETWRQMESLAERGLVRNLGTSNMTVAKLKLLLQDAMIMPVVNEMELHPHFQQPELFDFVLANQIQPIGYSPFGSPSRPERDRTPEDTVDLEDPVVLAIARAHETTPASICIKWAIQRGQVPIPFSVKASQYVASLAAAASADLTEDEMLAMSKIDRGCRLIKGQVFLWESANGWEDLWDLDGKIAQ